MLHDASDAFARLDKEVRHISLETVEERAR
jgi:hypothetical protein